MFRRRAGNKDKAQEAKGAPHVEVVPLGRLALTIGRIIGAAKARELTHFYLQPQPPGKALRVVVQNMGTDYEETRTIRVQNQDCVHCTVLNCVRTLRAFVGPSRIDAAWAAYMESLEVGGVPYLAFQDPEYVYAPGLPEELRRIIPPRMTAGGGWKAACLEGDPSDLITTSLCAVHSFTGRAAA